MNSSKEFVFKIIYKIAPFLYDLAYKKSIIFESAPDYADSTKAVYEEMVKRGLDKKYKFVWLLFGEASDALKISGEVKCMRGWTIKSRFYFYYLSTAKAYITCNRHLHKLSPKATFFYISHGNPIKDTSGYYCLPSSADYSVVTSDKSAELHEKYGKYPIEKIVPLGFPRNDILTKAGKESRQKIELVLGKYQKYIVWYPTFRQHKCGNIESASDDTLPVIHDESLAKQLNETAKENDVLIILKPHFVQDVSYIKDLNLSNIRFIDDSFFVEKDISSYEFVASCDALLSDYSSIYYDYLLCDKPIGLIWEDIEEYKKKPGLVENYEEYCAGGVKIYNVEELCQFVENVANGVDELKEERDRLCDIFNYARDGKNTERVVDFIIEKANL